jgi:SAM-dependent methyltransferase
MTCIVCGGARVEAFLDLGRTALANKCLAPEELLLEEPTYPLRVGFCGDCHHVQLMEHVPPPAMFEDYLYISSASQTLERHLHSLSDVVVARGRLGARDLVIDIGCNDGTLLDGFRRHGVRTLGVDPAKNLAALTQARGLERYIGFFTATSASEIAARWGQASAITATNTFPHIPALRDFVQGIKTALAPQGVFVIEAHYLLDIVEQLAFDTIYHEHVSYWALGPMIRVFREAGLEVVDVERLPIHHGQLRVFVQHRGAGTVRPSVQATLAAERAAGLDRFDTFVRFAQRTQALKAALTARLQTLRAQGKRVAGYGAPAKGNTLLSFLELDRATVEYIADRSPLKQGRFTPGRRIPVVPPERLLADRPDYVLLLAWNFAEEILAQQAAYRRQGGRFIIPVPEVTEV